ncbi:pyruvyltransferase superfamily protein [Syntrophotalea carbinolica DSM 2380]|uniref:Pyruvyltransferase superfamily protein n=1 Tax=Syntrophotalea carbinolica (strain DSM 2380 / NBRC 103641 / GraBd1) TaxID=338963 RepID=Q3A3L5_SYNC1|nr:polysaccharide pyruvyl transferase family protein [Syntrophotalea carbinolica]ABA89042.2 pyruvyltransferase superfamily protein [Syntrophotalea carbinolica DSM 2380]
MNAAFLYGYYGMKNTGDDALLSVCNWGVRKYLKVQKVFATSTKINNPYLGDGFSPVYRSKVFLRGENSLRAYLAASLSSSVVFGGGSVFHTAKYINKMAQFVKFAGKGLHFAVGVGVGPFRDLNAERACAKLFNNLSFVGVRDQLSFDIVTDICPNIRCEKTFDLAPLLPLLSSNNLNSKINTQPKKGIGFALCDYESFVGGDTKREIIRREKIKKFIDLLDPNEVQELIFIDFNGHYKFGDHKIHNEIIGKIDKRFKVTHISYHSNPGIALRAISNLRAMVAMRLHSAIFSYVVNIPSIILSYHEKCNQWANDIGVPSSCLFDSVSFDPSELSDSVRLILDGKIPGPILSPSKALELAFKNWTWLDE